MKNKLLHEFTEEFKITRQFLTIVPDNFDYKPTEKNMSMGRLATHVAEIPSWLSMAIQSDELDFAKGGKPNVCNNSAELLQLFDKCTKEALLIFENTDMETLDNNWTLRNGETIIFTISKYEVIRTWVLNHLVHHRAQLGLYLRMNNIALPSTYGPSGG
jgi:uncharacterized damage-inducible protein DinB